MQEMHAGDVGLILGSGRYPGEGNDNPLQYSCLDNPMDGGTWWATSPWGRKRVWHYLAAKHNSHLLGNVAYTLFSSPNIIMHSSSSQIIIKYIILNGSNPTIFCVLPVWVGGCVCALYFGELTWQLACLCGIRQIPLIASYLIYQISFSPL